MSLRDIEERITKNIKEKAELELEILKLKRAETERQEHIREVEARKRKAQLDHEAYIYERDREQRLKNEADTPRGRMLKAKEDARQNIKEDIKMGLTAKQIERKYLNPKDTVRASNRETEREVDNLLAKVNLSKFKTNLRDLT